MNFEFVRKEAKSLLKLCRSKDPLALARIRAGLPRIAKLTDDQAAVEVQLADVQQLLARESGLSNWSEFKQQALNKTSPDFSQPGNDGESLPDGFNPWSSCVSYTARPEIYAPLSYGREYLLLVRALHKSASYAELYSRALAIANGRVGKLQCNEGQSVYSRISAQGWFRYETIDVPTAYLSMIVTALKPGDPAVEGLSLPTAEELAAPG